jgi:Spy/CpxP family protein refolding chaperone
MRRKWLVYVLTFSLALNGATAVAFILVWWKSETLAAVSLGQKTIRGFLKEDLKLTNEQSHRILGQIDRSKQEAADLRGLMGAKRAEMISLICSAPINKDAVEAKMQEINRVQEKIRAAAVKTVITILESLPPESRDKFRAYLQARGRACDGCVPMSPRGGKAIPDR